MNSGEKLSKFAFIALNRSSSLLAIASSARGTRNVFFDRFLSFLLNFSLVNDCVLLQGE
jgi:hypothetical protein